jgi:prophage regulatory protein
MNTLTERILRLAEVKEMTQLSKTNIYGSMKKGTFPQSLKLGLRSIGWRLSDVNFWMSNLSPAQEK